jgi:hypothetical protein
VPKKAGLIAMGNHESKPSASSAKRKHLLPPEAIAAHAGTNPESVVRGRRQGIGLRVHGVYFLAVSCVVLVVLIVFIAMASAM